MCPQCAPSVFTPMHSEPVTPPIGAVSEVYAVTEDDVNFLTLLTASEPKTVKEQVQAHYRRRDAPLDPLLLAAAASAGPHITRHHYHHHDLYPDVDIPEGIWDWTVWDGSANKEDTAVNDEPQLPILQPPRYVSQQAPRSVRLSRLSTPSRTPSPVAPAVLLPSPPLTTLLAPLDTSPNAPMQVQCMARTRIPTPHGHAFLHLYKNNKDAKEHLAIVVDSAQLSDPSSSSLSATPIRSRTLDAKWTENESDMDRLTRGAYVGRLSATSQLPSRPLTPAGPVDPTATTNVTTPGNIPAPLVRIHSECFTGETIGSMRCDCGEQLDEALRLISQPVDVPNSTVIPGRGAIIYLRQEGRNIGLLSKIRAYNLQDMGHDTVTANLLLGHGADERTYDIAGEIMKDLGLNESGVRLLTNNPDKVQKLEKEGVKVVQRVGMVPRSWTCVPHDHVDDSATSALTLTLKAQQPCETEKQKEYDEWRLRSGGATLIGGGAARGEELERYLRTKVERMGHLLDLPTH